LAIFLKSAGIVGFMVKSRLDVQARKNYSGGVISDIGLRDDLLSLQIIYGFYRSGRNNMQLVVIELCSVSQSRGNVRYLVLQPIKFWHIGRDRSHVDTLKIKDIDHVAIRGNTMAGASFSAIVEASVTGSCIFSDPVQPFAHSSRAVAAGAQLRTDGRRRQQCAHRRRPFAADQRARQPLYCPRQYHEQSNPYRHATSRGKLGAAERA
jgi:hypothetical protein